MAVALGMWGLGPAIVQATPNGYTNFDDFTAAVEGLGLSVAVEGFDSVTSTNSVINSGASVAGYTFTYSGLLGGASLLLTNSQGAINKSPDWSIGGNAAGIDDDQLGNPDGFTVTFPEETQAFGLWFQSEDPPEDDPNFLAPGIYDDDISLTVGGQTETNNNDDVEIIVNAGDNPYENFDYYSWFIGFVDPLSPFTTAQVSTIDLGAPSFFFRVDDFVTARTPIAGSLPLLGLGIGLLALRLRARRR